MKRKMKQRAIQQHRQQRNIQAMLNKKHCPHGFDIACLICGFGEQNNNKRVYHSWSKKTGELA